MSSSRGPVSTPTFTRFVGGRLGDELPSDQRRSRPPFGTVGSPTGGHERKEQNNMLPNGSRSSAQNSSDSEGRVPHSFTLPSDARAAAVGTGGGAGR
jgi:hypothetical protein